VSEPIQTVEQLVAAREARGLGPDDVVRQLKLAPRQLQAIERGDWEALPGPAFTRAVLRSYGRVLGVDIEPLVSSVSPAAREAELKPAATLDEPMPTRSMFGFGSGGGGSRLAWTLLVVLGVIALALFFGGRTDLSDVRSWLSELRGAAQGDATPRPGDAAPAVAPTEKVPLTLKDAPPRSEGAGGRGADSPQAVQGGALDASPVPADAAAAAAPGAGAPAAGGVTGADAAASAGAAAPPVEPAARAGAAVQGSRRVVLRFERESWVEARGADGAVLFTGTNRAQTTREFTATGTVSLVIGNAEFVRAEVDGSRFDLAPHIRASVARVTLP